uniref:tetratricopeptide repeat protein n=1 Tax=Acetobacterium sp. TaxID=1872094 RepID=UPI003594047D
MNSNENENQNSENGFDPVGDRTEELLTKKQPENQSHRKKMFFIIGLIGGVCILVVSGFLIMNQMNISQIEKNLELGEKYLEEGKYEEAILAYDDVIKIDQKNVLAYEGKGATYLGMANYSEAESQLETAKSIDFTDNGKVLMSEVYINTDRKDQGMA